MDIVALTQQNRKDANHANQPFEVIGLLKPQFSGGVWSWSEELFDRPRWKRFPDYDEEFYDLHIDNPNKGAYLAYDQGECIGQLVLRADWNGYAFIEDICVARAARGRGVGTALMETAVRWARERELSGLALETQDNNLLACRFYIKRGFQIGGVNTLFYRNCPEPSCHETAIFWYLLF